MVDSHVNEDYVKMILQGRCIILCSLKIFERLEQPLFGGFIPTSV